MNESAQSILDNYLCKNNNLHIEFEDMTNELAEDKKGNRPLSHSLEV